jgi:hypothetical protein
LREGSAAEDVEQQARGRGCDLLHCEHPPYDSLEPTTPADARAMLVELRI